MMPGFFAELAPDFFNDLARGPADGPDRQRAEEVDQHGGQKSADPDIHAGQVHCVHRNTRNNVTGATVPAR